MASVAPQMDHRRLLASMSVLSDETMEPELSEACVSIMSFAIEMLLPLPAAAVLLNTCDPNLVLTLTLTLTLTHHLLCHQDATAATLLMLIRVVLRASPINAC
eukprot:9469450-Pyramimonas_sp.AAC.1